MRPELELIELIEKYLSNELSDSDKMEFENRMNRDSRLREEVELQSQVMSGVKRVALKRSIQKAYKKYKIGKSGWKWGLGSVVVIAALASLPLINQYLYGEGSYKPDLNENGESEWVDADKNLPSQIFKINTSKDNIIETDAGIVIAIPANAFLDDKGNIVDGDIELEVKEALDPSVIIQGGLSTESNGKLLETGGMFYINARKKGKSLKIDSEKGLLVDVPTDKIKKGMQLFDGERTDSGTINWVNPKELESFLTPVDIHSLNFYPPNYEDSLASWKSEVTDKETKDSIYYSFTCENEEGEAQSDLGQLMNSSDNQKVFKFMKLETSEQLVTTPKWTTYYKDLSQNKFRCYFKATIPKDWYLYGKSNASIGPIPLTVKIKPNSGWKKAGKLVHPKGISFFDRVFEENVTIHRGEVVFYQDVEMHQSYNQDVSFIIEGQMCSNITGQCVSIEEHLTISFYLNSDTASSYSCGGIEPSKIKAIWNDEFQNTNLATKEFEERLQYIFTTCSNELLDIYVRNLNLPLYKVDSIAAISHPGFSKRLWDFYNRKDGRVEIENSLSKKLGDYYSEKSKIYAQVVAKTNLKFWKEQQNLDNDRVEKESENTIENLKRKSENYKKELDMNMDEAYRQLGKKSTNNVLPPNTTYTANVTTTGWKNVDVYVVESTTNRKTLDYTDPDGKKAVIEYKELSISIENEEQYDRVSVYLVSDQQYSFMRILKENGSYNESLNELLDYNLVCVGYIGDEVYLKSKSKVKSGEKNLNLKKTTKAKFNRRLNALCGSKSFSDISQDQSFQLFQKRDNARKKRNEELIDFRGKMERVIFPCRSYDSANLESYDDIFGYADNITITDTTFLIDTQEVWY